MTLHRADNCRVCRANGTITVPRAWLLELEQLAIAVVQDELPMHQRTGRSMAPAEALLRGIQARLARGGR